MASVTAVIELLMAKKIPFEVLPHRETFSAAAEAQTLRVDLGEVLKTVVLDTESGHAIVVAPASCQLDINLVREALTDKHAHLATETEMLRDFPGFELGSVPPVPSLAKVPVYVDPEVMTHPTVIFAEAHGESVRVKTEDLFSGEFVTVTPLARRFEKTFAMSG